MPKIQRVKVDDPVSAEIWNAVADKLRPFAKIATSQGCGLTCATGPHGTNLALTMPQDIYARLSGSSSPYSWTNAMQTAGGTFTDRTAGLTGGTSNVYEVNGKAGLAGKVVPITWTAAGDWRFQWVGYGGCPLTFTLNHPTTCPARGATVDFKVGGVTVFSGTTNINGQVIFPGASASGSYTIAWSFAGLTGTTSATGCTPVTVVTGLPAGYTENCADAMPTLYITDTAGTRQIYPTPACANFTYNGINYSWRSFLTVLGSCPSPSWRLRTQRFFPATDCPIGPSADGTDTFSMSCTSPMSHSGTTHNGVPEGPYSGGDNGYMIHE